MAGYPETLTDPSYAGQILVLTYPLIGNYGVPTASGPSPESGRLQSGRIQVAGLVVQHLSRACFALLCLRIARRLVRPTLGAHPPRRRHARADAAPARAGHDAGLAVSRTPWAARRRSAGAVSIEMRTEVFHRVAPSEPVRYDGGDLRDSADRHRCQGRDRPLPAQAGRFCHPGAVALRSRTLAGEADGVMISNGPGDPADLGALTDQVRRMLSTFAGPIFGICLGHQILARAAGFDTYKLKYGHRGVNQPVREVGLRALLRHQPEPRLRGRRAAAAVRLEALVREPERRHERRPPVPRAARTSACSSIPKAALGRRTRSSCSITSWRWRGRLRSERCVVTQKLRNGPAARLRPAADRPGGRVRLLGLAGAQGAARTGRAQRPGQPEHRHDTDQRGTRRSRLPRAGQRRVRHAGHRARRHRRDHAVVRRPDGAQLRARTRRQRRARTPRRTVLGTPVATIRDTEDRELFSDRLDEIGVRIARSIACSTIDEARQAIEQIGLPVMLRGGYRARWPRQRHRRAAARDRGEPEAGIRRRRAPGAGRGKPAGLEGDRVRDRPRRGRQLHHRVQHGELRSHGHPHGRVHRRRAVPDPRRRRIPDAADRGDTHAPGILASSASATSSSRSTRTRATTA